MAVHPERSEIGARLRIEEESGPHGADGRLPVVVARGAFGSGEHETTASCLEILETLPEVAGARVLDLGSGTGILSAAAIALGAAAAVCVDPDPRATEACRRTAELNGLESHMRRVEGVLSDVTEAPFDVVVANVYADVLLTEVARLLSLARPNAPIVLSGIAWEYAFDVRQRYLDHGAKAVAGRWLDDYVTLLLRAPEKPTSSPR
jgi:ribosomal protein L11 methyltransferase